MRAVIIIVILAAVGFFGYEYVINGRDPATAISALTGGAEADAPDDVSDNVEDAADAVEDATSDADAAIDDSEAEAAAAVDEAADAAVDAANDAADATEEAAADVTEEATEATDAVNAELDNLLSVDGFDADRITTFLQEADLSTLEQTTLTNAINAAQENPDLVEPVIERLRQVLISE